MTGKQLNELQRTILGRLFQLAKLKDSELAWVMGVGERTIRRRRYEYAETGQLRKHKDVSQNAAKLKPHHLEKLLEFHKNHPDAMLKDLQSFLRETFNVEVSVSSISRHVSKAHGDDRKDPKARPKKPRGIRRRAIAPEIQQGVGGNGGNGGNGVNVSNTAQTAAAHLYQDQYQLAPLQHLVAQHETPRQELGLQGPMYHAHAAVGRQ